MPASFLGQFVYVICTTHLRKEDFPQYVLRGFELRTIRKDCSAIELQDIFYHIRED